MSLKENGFTIVDSAADQNVHMLGCHRNSEAIISIAWTRIAQLQISALIFGVSTDGRAV